MISAQIGARITDRGYLLHHKIESDLLIGSIIPLINRYDNNNRMEMYISSIKVIITIIKNIINNIALDKPTLAEITLHSYK